MRYTLPAALALFLAWAPSEGAYRFTAANSEYAVQTITSALVTPPFSMAFDFYCVSSDGAPVAVGSTTNSHQIRAHPCSYAQTYAKFGGSTVNCTDWSAQIPTGEWCRYVFYGNDGGSSDWQMKVYCPGSNVSKSCTANVDIGTPTVNRLIYGARMDWGSLATYHDGRTSGVAFWNIELSDAQASALLGQETSGNVLPLIRSVAPLSVSLWDPATRGNGAPYVPIIGGGAVSETNTPTTEDGPPWSVFWAPGYAVGPPPAAAGERRFMIVMRGLLDHPLVRLSP